MVKLRGPNPIPIEERFWEKVDKKGPIPRMCPDLGNCWLWTAALDRKGYGVIGIRGSKIGRAHRVSWKLTTGEDPVGLLDHRCQVRACVRPSHLRPASNKQNIEHQKMRTDNTSGIRGVSWDKSRGKWTARIGHHGKIIVLGRFGSKEEAAAAVVARRLELFTHNDADRQVTTP